MVASSLKFIQQIESVLLMKACVDSELTMVEFFDFAGAHNVTCQPLTTLAVTSNFALDVHL